MKQDYKNKIWKYLVLVRSSIKLSLNKIHEGMLEGLHKNNKKHVLLLLKVIHMTALIMWKKKLSKLYLPKLYEC